MMPDKKSLASILASEGEEPMYDEMEEGEKVEGEDVAAEELMSALQAGDTRGFKTALKAFIDICRS